MMKYYPPINEISYQKDKSNSLSKFHIISSKNKSIKNDKEVNYIQREDLPCPFSQCQFENCVRLFPNDQKLHFNKMSSLKVFSYGDISFFENDGELLPGKYIEELCISSLKKICLENQSNFIVVFYASIIDEICQKYKYLKNSNFFEKLIKNDLFKSILYIFPDKFISRNLSEFLSYHWQGEIEFIDTFVEEDFEEFRPKIDKLSESIKSTETYYEPYMSFNDIQIGVDQGRIVEGVLKTISNTVGIVCVKNRINRHIPIEVKIGNLKNLNRCLNGDSVYVEILPNNDVDDGEILDITEDIEDEIDNSSDPPHGKIVSLIERRIVSKYQTNYVGSIDISNNSFVAIRKNAPILRIKNCADFSTDILEKSRVVCVISGEWQIDQKWPNGIIIEIIGNRGVRQVESTCILREHNVDFSEFSKAVYDCLPRRKIKPDVNEKFAKIEDFEFSEEIKRQDFRESIVFSIDPPGCKDIDDALSCRQIGPNRYEVGVHIADVSYYVKPNTAIDSVAAQRSTTVYLVEKRTDMLPSLLTTNLCSLVPNVDRYVFSVLWKIEKGARGQWKIIGDAEFHRGIIKSVAALSYSEANDILNSIENFDILSQKHAGIENIHMLREMRANLSILSSFTKFLNEERLLMGALKLASSEVKFTFDSGESPSGVSSYQTFSTNSLVEEMMLLANQAVGVKILSSIPGALLRGHPPPQMTKLESLNMKLGKIQKMSKSPLIIQLGIDYGVDFPMLKFGSNLELSASLSRLDGYFDQILKKSRTISTPILSALKSLKIRITRCMNQAQYLQSEDIKPGQKRKADIDMDKFSHYGLAMNIYTHFTSPIRRYADIVVHRQLENAISHSDLKFQINQMTVDNINFRHKQAQFASRESNRYHVYTYFNNLGKIDAVCLITSIDVYGTGDSKKMILSLYLCEYGIETETIIDTIDIDEDMTVFKFMGVEYSLMSFALCSVSSTFSNLRHELVVELKSSIDSVDLLSRYLKKVDHVEETMFPDRLEDAGQV